MTKGQKIKKISRISKLKTFENVKTEKGLNRRIYHIILKPATFFLLGTTALTPPNRILTLILKILSSSFEYLGSTCLR